jgi:nucleotide-binding universal stress UspA family protein
MKILMAVDGSEHTKRMLSYVAAHDDLLGRTHDYTFFTVVTPIPPHAAKYLGHDALAEYYDEQAAQVFKPILAFAEQQGWKVRTVHATAHAADAIAEIAEREKHDLVVLGSHGHTALGNVLLGSVASGVLARCKVPVLLIR